MHLVGFIIRIYHDTRSPERQIRILTLICSHARDTDFGDRQSQANEAASDFR